MGAKLLRGSHGVRPPADPAARAVGGRRLTVAAGGRSSVAVRAQQHAKVKVEFRLPKKLQYGSSAYLVGSAKGLGEWNAERSQSMTWTDGDVWQSVLEVEPGETLEYKYVVRTDDGEEDEWQSCGNQTLQVEDGFRCVVITDNWKGPERGRDVAVERVEEGEGGSKADAEKQQEQEAVVMHQTEPAREEQQQQQEPPAAEEPPMVPVNFRVRKQLDYGHMLRMVGGCEQMGSWKLGGGLQMEWTNGDLWRAKAYVLPGEALEYKYVVVDSDGTYEEWQDGLNKQLLVEEGSASVQVKDSWRQDTKAHLDVARGPVTDEPPQELLQKLKEAAEAEEKAAAAAEAAAKAEEKAAAAAVAAAAQEAAVKAAAEKAGEAAVAADAETEEAVEEVVEEAAAPQVNGVAAPLNGEAVESPKVAVAALEQEQKQEEKEQQEEQVFDIVTPSGRLMRNMTVKELKAELKDLGLRTVGRKAELVVRLSEFLSSQDEI